MTVKHHRCDELGVCQGLGPDQCPDCDSFDCEVACAPRDLPYYPFAPGVIDGGPSTPRISADDSWLPLSLHDTLYLVAILLVLVFMGSVLAGYLHG